MDMIICIFLLIGALYIGYKTGFEEGQKYGYKKGYDVGIKGEEKEDKS